MILFVQIMNVLGNQIYHYRHYPSARLCVRHAWVTGQILSLIPFIVLYEYAVKYKKVLT